MTYSQSTQSTQALFQPFTIGNLTLPNRIVMAPMARQFAPGGVPGPDMAAYYRRRAENGVGLIVTGGTLIDHPDTSHMENIPRFFGEAALAGWANAAAAVHEAGGRIIPQLSHIGERGHVGDYSEAELADIVQAFARAAAAAKRIGFDGIELHGGHGFLIDQFFWEKTNPRTDRYGGDIAGRTRFAVEVIEASRRAVGPDFPIGLRFSQWKMSDYTARLAETPEMLEQILAPLAEAGIDMFHLSTRRFWEPEFAGSELNLAGWVKKLTGKPTITVGSVGLDGGFAKPDGKDAGAEAIGALIARLERGEFDLVAVGRALLADPAWASKIRDGRFDELVLFTPEAEQTLY
ncbi:NADH:flavin oxidoreductase [Paenibacillus sp. FSL R5-0527]|uniref:NADH:flavin oxidoreductase n=1 Tax=Paenibacillus TaxID=44249 RepID=UPI00097A69AB|nr:12-oxophytodienoate reductase [Paenibacillus macerans]